MHRTAANSRVDIERVKLRWSKEEAGLLAAEEVRLIRAKASFLNKALHHVFPSRTLDAIKGYRRKDEYKDLVKSLLDMPEGPVRPPSDDDDLADGGEVPPQQQEAIGDPSLSIQEYLNRLKSRPVVNAFRDSDLNSIVEKALLGENVTAELDLFLRDIFKQYLPPRRRGKGRRKAHVPSSRRGNRRSEYAAMQNLYKKNRSEAARKVLEDEPDKGDIPELKQFEDAWRPILSAESPEVPECETPPPPAKVELWAAISIEEIEAQQRSVDGAPGIDGVPPRIVKRMPPQVLAKIFNIILLSEEAPTCFLESRTIFIPKSMDTASPLNFRPISIASHVSRLFHKVLAARLLSAVPYEPCQRAFLKADGCSENVALLEAIIQKSKREYKEVHMAVLDLQKAYDSVAHEAILGAAKEKGIPDPFLRYLKHSYSNSNTRLQVNGEESERIAVRRGVRQGDPLSPALFNYVIDTLISRLPPGIGFELGEGIVTCLAFADDLILIGSTKEGLQRLLNKAQAVLAPQGLQFNVAKCRSLSVVPSGREKKTKVITEPQFLLANELLRPTGVEETFKYLGVQYTPQGKVISPQTAFMALLERVKKAPLKPQQRIFILRVFLIPKLYHQLVLGRTRMGDLKKLDIKIRNSVKDWLRLPHDTPTAFFHAEGAQGGLGIPSLRWAIPRLIVERLGNLAKSPNPVFRSLAEDVSVQSAISRARRWAHDGRELVLSKAVEYRRFARLLHDSCDGKGLRECADVKAAHSWVTDGTKLMSGNEYIECVKLRINALPVKCRTGRGRKFDTKCRAGCGVPETLPHVLQMCHRTHGARVQRHDGLTKLLAKTLESTGWTVEREFLYRTAKGNHKPDIVAKKDGVLRVIETHVCSDKVSLAQYRRQKLAPYASNDLLLQSISKRWKLPVSKENLTTATLTYRGVWDKTSAHDLKLMGLRGSIFRLLSVRAIQGSLQTFRLFNRMTTQL